ncbi:TIGR00725 family protein [bacterium]|nr:TIGR00725 family protein [bacterium]
MKSRIIGVIGGGSCTEEMQLLAEAVGRRIALSGSILICGGLDGVMLAACRGAKLEDGLTIGILPGLDKKEANSYVDIPIVSGMADARNVIIARTADALIAIDGEFGTLSEISFAIKFGKPLIGLKTWAVSDKIIPVNGAEEAVEKALQVIS